MSSSDLAHEQTYVSTLYDRLAELEERARQRLAELPDDADSPPSVRSERAALATREVEKLARYRAAETGLCFGRIDLADGERRYIGRIGLFDDSGDHEPMLIDWRAPAARPFYLATAAAPMAVHRRRHLRLRGRVVTELRDEVLDSTTATPGDATLVGEAALLAELAAVRTGRMRDIIGTIQAEQDHVIRSEHRGVLVVEGGPGTGKTAVALHRAAYLLYTYREQLAHRGVLVVGPNQTFVGYIDQVLPSLGETGVRMATLADLLPGVTADATEPAEVAEVKGRAVMAEVVAAAVRDRQQVPAEPTPVTLTDRHPSLAYQAEVVTLEPADCAAARDAARATGLPHNRARRSSPTNC